MKNKTVHIATLGRNEQGRIGYVFAKRGGDVLVILHSPEHEEDAKRILREVSSGGHIDVENRPVEPWNYHSTLQTAVEVAVKYHGNVLRFNPSLGTRVMSAALIATANLTGSVAYLVKEDQNARAVDVIDVHPVQRQTLSPPKKALLAELLKVRKEGVPSQGDLARRLKKSRASVSDLVEKLSEWGYVVSSPEKKEKRVKITDLGGAVLKMAELWKSDR